MRLCVSAFVFGMMGAAFRPVAGQAPPPSRVVIGAGVSVMEFDANQDRASRGLVLRAGVAPVWFADISAVAAYWPDLGLWRGATLAAEATFYPVGRPRVAPFVQFGLGYFQASDKFDLGLDPLAGVTKTFGIGVTGRLSGAWGLRLDASARFDPGSFDDELRLAAVYGPEVRRPADLVGGRVLGAVYALVPITGPWRLAEPGFGLSFATPISATHDLDADVVLLHWNTSGSSAFSGWDTRAVLVLPALALVSGRGAAYWHVGAGPSATLMFEGPDDGLRGGMHLDAGLTGDVGAGVVGSAAVSLLWLVRVPNPAFTGPGELAPTDQRGILVRLGVGF